MTSTTTDGDKHVLVVSGDARVAAALASLLDAIPGLAGHSALGTPGDVEDAVAAVHPDVAVVDVTHSNTARDVLLVRRLARRLPVVALCDSETLATGAARNGVVCCCEKDGNVDALMTAVLGLLGGPTGRTGCRTPAASSEH